MSSRYLDLARKVMRDDTGTESTPPRCPGRGPERPCIGCRRECRDGELFHDATCFEAWRARRRHARLAQGARSATAAARGIPAGTNAPGGAA